MNQPKREVWMRGPLEGYETLLQPVAHALVQAQEDVMALADTVSHPHAFERPGGAASIAFHVRHLGGATDRLLTYARGEALTPTQMAALKAEGVFAEGDTLRDVARVCVGVLDEALEQLRRTRLDDLLTPRKIGRAEIPTNTLGLLFHAAEHATRHAGQALTTAKILAAAP